jgi:catechol 2,3-dioxygenase-like lactoylglutathione lyase family enzyme
MIFVNDLPRMTAFYAGTLGLKPIDETRQEGYVEFEAGPSTFALHAIPEAHRCEISVPPKLREMTAVKLTFEVEDVAAERKRLETLGVTILDRPWGSYDAADPEGNVFGIYSRSN